MEVRLYPLGSGARGGGPAMPAGILDCEEEAAGEEAEEAMEAEEAEEENSSDKI